MDKTYEIVKYLNKYLYFNKVAMQFQTYSLCYLHMCVNFFKFF